MPHALGLGPQGPERKRIVVRKRLILAADWRRLRCRPSSIHARPGQLAGMVDAAFAHFATGATGASQPRSSRCRPC
jgi:hypothetical protein